MKPSDGTKVEAEVGLELEKRYDVHSENVRAGYSDWCVWYVPL